MKVNSIYKSSIMIQIYCEILTFLVENHFSGICSQTNAATAMKVQQETNSS